MNPQTQIQMFVNEKVRHGRHANGVQVSQLRDETILDFLLTNPAHGQGDVVARVVVSNQFLAEFSAALATQITQLQKTPATSEKPVVKQIGFKGTNDLAEPRSTSMSSQPH